MLENILWNDLTMEGGNVSLVKTLLQLTSERTDAKDDISATARRISRTDNFNFSIYHFTMSGEVYDKQGNPIEVGDEVVTKMRGGKRQGVVCIHLSLRDTIWSWQESWKAEDIVMSEEEAKEKGVKHPPKVKCLGSSLLSPYHT